MARNRTTFPPGKGTGWGGPARGPGAGPKFEKFMEGNQTEHPAGDDYRERRQKRRELRAAGAERLQQLKDHLADLALNAEHEATQVSATVAWLNRDEGMPAQTNKNLNVDVISGLPLDQQRAIAAALDALPDDAGDDAGGAAPQHH